MSKLVDRKGKRYGKLVVLEYSTEKHKWKCQCDCGKIIYRASRYLKIGGIQSCGCHRPKNSPKLIDMSGQKFNMLTVINYDKEKRSWLCKCDCGNLTYVKRQHLINNVTKSCGCYHDRNNDINFNETYKKLYRVFDGMKKRCYYEKSKDFKNYGAKGIKICDEWLNDFRNFYNWAMDNGYKIINDGFKNKMCIDRIDSNKDYCPENCRWISIEDNSARVSRYNDELIKFENETEKEKYEKFLIAKQNDMSIKKNKKQFFFRKPIYSNLKNINGEKQYLFKRIKDVALFLNISDEAVRYREKHKNGMLNNFWKLERISKEEFDKLKEDIEVIY